MELTYHIVIFGCQMNKSDSERVRTVIERMGYLWTEHEEDADLLGVLACSVRQKSIDKVYARIRKWNAWKGRKNLLTFISGCVLPADRTRFLKLFDLVFSITELPELPDMIRQYGVVTPFARVNSNSGIKRPAGERRGRAAVLMQDQLVPAQPMKKGPDERIRDFWKLRPVYVSAYEAFIPIQNGCDKFCTFCAVPYTRGREISRSSEEIMEELRNLVDRGYKLITLLGQNVNAYGRDTEGREMTFPDLLRTIGEYGKSTDREFWVYFTSPHPEDMTDELLEVIASYACLAKQIHLPLQSGDDELLRRMNRGHNIIDYEEITRSIRRYLPTATLFTDIIVGFCGESREQFENTRSALERIGFNMAYIAAYSPRPGAVSARWEDTVTTAEKKERLHILTEVLMHHSLAYNREMIGRTVRVIVTGEDRKEGYLSGLTEGRIVVRFPSGKPVKTGSFVWLKITGAAALSVEGIPVGEMESTKIPD